MMSLSGKIKLKELNKIIVKKLKNKDMSCSVKLNLQNNNKKEFR